MLKMYLTFHYFKTVNIIRCIKMYAIVDIRCESKYVDFVRMKCPITRDE